MDPITIAMGLAQLAPGIIKMISGSDKAAEVAEQVVDVAKVVTGQPTGEAALESLKADPNLVLEFRTKILEVEADIEKAYLADRQDARKTAVELAKSGAPDRKSWMIVGDIIGLIVCIVLLTYVPELPGEVRGIISTIAGFFGLGLRDAHQYEFGSSRGSQEKGELLAKHKP